MTEQENQTTQSPGILSSGVLFAILALLFGLGMALVGFLVGRATAPVLQRDDFIATLPAQSEKHSGSEIVSESPVDNLPTVVISTIVVDSTATATPIPTAQPTDQPTVTAEPTATIQPTVELIPTEVITTPLFELLPPLEGSPLAGADYTTLYEVWDLIGEAFDGPVPPSEEILESIISGSLDTLDDDYTRYVAPDVAERMRQDQEGSIEGIGAFVIENDEGLFEIARPMDGQPADLAGVKAGDVLIEVDGQSVLDLSFDEVILLVRGPQGTSVHLKFLRDGEPVEFTIVRARFEVPVVEFEILPAEMTGGEVIGYIHLTEFNRFAEEKLLEALEQIDAQGATGIVFDLRDNPGGFLDQSVAVADAFLPEGVALFERNIRGLNETFVTRDGGAAETIPLVVLVNAGSASASEIVAGAIQDRGRAVLVGEKTFGKGSVQQIHSLSDGSELRVTIARWFTPNNNSIDGVGITPNIEVETPEDLGGLEDGQLIRAIEYLLTGH